jgi:hypothetical protein
MNASASTSCSSFGTRAHRPPAGRGSWNGRKQLVARFVTATSAEARRLEVTHLTRFNVNQHHSSLFITIPRKIFNLREFGSPNFNEI